MRARGGAGRAASAGQTATSVLVCFHICFHLTNLPGITVTGAASLKGDPSGAADVWLKLLTYFLV